MDNHPAIHEIQMPKTLPILTRAMYRMFGCPRCNFDQFRPGLLKDSDGIKVGICGDCGGLFGESDEECVSFEDYAIFRYVSHPFPVTRHHTLGNWLRIQKQRTDQALEEAMTQANSYEDDDHATIPGDDGEPAELILAGFTQEPAVALVRSVNLIASSPREMRRLLTGLEPTQVPMNHGACRNGITLDGSHCDCVFD